MKKVLLFPCDSEIAREVLESLRNNKKYIIIGGTSVNGKGRYLPYDDFVTNIPYFTEDNFIDFLQKINVDYIFPCHDSVSLLLSKNKDLFNSKIVTHSYLINDFCRNKDKTYELLSRWDYESSSTNLTPKYELKNFPRFLKPKDSNGSKGVMLINNKEELDCYFSKHLKENTLSLEYLPGDECTVDCFSKKGELLFAGPRSRKSVQSGISDISVFIEDSNISSIAKNINNIFKNIDSGFHGAWFFQIKKDINNLYKVLEVGSRISGGMSFYRMAGKLNFAEASIEILENDSFVLPQHKTLRINGFSKFLIPKFKYDKIKYNNVYVDFDDTLYFNNLNKINKDLLKLIFQEIDNNKKIILITRSKNNYLDILEKYRIKDLFDVIIHINNKEEKYNLIEDYSILIDDSFRERNFYRESVYCFGLDNFKILLED
jgi:hypothetical protein